MYCVMYITGYCYCHYIKNVYKKMYVTITWAKHCIRRWAFIPLRIRAISIPIQGNSLSFPFPFPNFVINSHSHGIPIGFPMGMGIPLGIPFPWSSLTQRSWAHVPALPLFYWVATFCKLFNHIVFPVFSAPRNWHRKGSIRTGPI